MSSHFKNIEKIEEMATMFIQSDCLKSLRAKRYQSIASAAIIHSFRHNHIPITLKEY